MSDERKKRVTDLIKKAKGNRSLRKYAEDAGVSPSGIYRILNENYIPKPLTIKKLTSEAAKPQGGVTFEDVMIAAGYVEATVEEKIEAAANEKAGYLIRIDQDENKDDACNHNFNERGYMRRHLQKIREEERAYTEYFQEKIVSNLVKKRLGFEYTDRHYIEDLRHPYFDLILTIKADESVHIDEWLFWGMYSPDLQHERNIFRLYDCVGLLSFCPPRTGRKISIVLNSRFRYDKLRNYEDNLSYRGELSVIYINPDDNKIEEFYLAHYKENDRTQEIYLA